MKKFIFLILLLVILPLNVKAASIKNTTLVSGNEAIIGKTYSVSFGVNFDGIQKGSADSLGIAAVTYELVFDDSVFEIIDVISSSDTWESEVYKDDGKYYVLSMVTDSNRLMNKCIDGILYCADYIISLEFLVKDTETTETSIQIGDVEAGLLNMIDKTYTEDEIMENATYISYNNYVSKIITLKKEEITNNKENKENSSSKTDNNTEEVNKPTNVDSSKPTNKVTTPTKNEEPNVQKSNNNYIGSLEIENYAISFDKTVTNYDLFVENDVNSLNLKIVLEDNNAKYRTKGTYNLSENNNKVEIIVTAQNGDKKTYTINVQKESKDVIQNKTENKKFEIDSKYIKLGIIIGSCLLILIIVISIINSRNNKKIDKAFDDI